MINQKGSFDRTLRFLTLAQKINYQEVLRVYGAKGVSLLSSATPIDTGKTSKSWDYSLTILKGRYVLSWTNSNVINGVNIAVILQYGHATRNGSWVEGLDYINPTVSPLFQKLSDDLWKEVSRL